MLVIKNHRTFILFFGIFLMPFLSSLSSQSNEGKVFWFGFMEHLDVGQNTMVAMITSKYNTSGTISVPNNGWSQQFSVSANDVVIINLPSNIENIGSEVKRSLGVKLTSEDPVSVYIHQYHNARSEASVVLPMSSLGKEYYVMTYTGVTRNGTVHPSEFLIVAPQDETTINITLSDDSERGKSAGTSFSILLNAGETYQVQADLGSGDLSGTHISGDKNFAVFGGNSWTEVPTGCAFRDNLLEQMFP
ncbi:MAG: hypothetical protein HKN68_11235, partial [Saprospiraceae bacterium]|nr:hypothetical protein [Saprospiraceae bacterium]